MRILVNGEWTQLTAGAGCSLLDALVALGYTASAEPAGAPQRVPADVRANFVVALNQHIVSAAQYAATALRDGDSIDILGAITGG